MSGLLAWAVEGSPPPPVLLYSRESPPLVPGMGRELVGFHTKVLPDQRVEYLVLADGSVRLQAWSR